MKLTFVRCVCWCVRRRWPPKHHPPGSDFGGQGGDRGPYLCSPSTSDRVQNRFEFVELARDMSSGGRSHSWAATRYQRALCTWCAFFTKLLFSPINTTTAQPKIVQFRDHDIVVQYHHHHHHHPHNPVLGTFFCDGGGGGGGGDGGEGGSGADRTFSCSLIAMETEAPNNRLLYMVLSPSVLLCRVPPSSYDIITTATTTITTTRYTVHTPAAVVVVVVVMVVEVKGGASVFFTLN